MRTTTRALVDEAVAKGARKETACAVLGISVRSLQRWSASAGCDARQGPKTKPAHQLSSDEEKAILRIANSPEYRNLSPEQIVAKLADEGSYICSEASLRRILKRHQQAAHKQRSRPATNVAKPRAYAANGPLQVLTWDITYLRNRTVRGDFFFLYLFMDIWSRRIVGWAVHDSQCSTRAAALLEQICLSHDMEPGQCVVHSDNRAAMKGSTMLATMHQLGITSSFSRPSVSDDNAFVESLFRHLKYAPAYPSKGFHDLAEARRWVGRFVTWYNDEHMHSAIGYVTPQQRHDGADIAILDARRKLYATAKNSHPRRWTRAPRRWRRPAIVTLNPDKDRVAAFAPKTAKAA